MTQVIHYQKEIHGQEVIANKRNQVVQVQANLVAWAQESIQAQQVQLAVQVQAHQAQVVAQVQVVLLHQIIQVQEVIVAYHILMTLNLIQDTNKKL